LLRVASHPILSRDPVFLGFLQQKEGWQEALKDFGKYFIEIGQLI
jgi:hypothetical protein